MDRPLRFSQLSVGRKVLVRLCQSINYGHIQNLKVEYREPVLQGTSVIAITDVRLDAEDPARPELEMDDFILCEEVTRLIALFDKIQNATISKIEVRAGLPRRISFEHHFSDKNTLLYLSVVRQAGSRDPVRRLMADPKEDGSLKAAGHLRDAGDGGVRKDPPPKGIPGNL
jgi:hypothetical protein